MIIAIFNTSYPRFISRANDFVKKYMNEHGHDSDGSPTSELVNVWPPF